MNVRLDYRDSGNTYSEHFSDFKAKVSISESGKRVNISFREKRGGTPYASLSLPYEKAQQLAYALLTASAGDAEPIEFSVEEARSKATA